MQERIEKSNGSCGRMKSTCDRDIYFWKWQWGWLSQQDSRVFHSLYKVGRNGNFVLKGFNNKKKRVNSSGARPGARDYYWFRSPMPNHMS